MGGYTGRRFEGDGHYVASSPHLSKYVSLAETIGSLACCTSGSQSGLGFAVRVTVLQDAVGLGHRQAIHRKLPPPRAPPHVEANFFARLGLARRNDGREDHLLIRRVLHPAPAAALGFHLDRPAQARKLATHRGRAAGAVARAALHHYLGL